MPKFHLVTGSIIALVFLALFGVGLKSVFSETPGEYDEFAQCLTDSGTKMYGAYWCPYCQEQKKELGSSWQYINYIECSLPNRAGTTAVCQDAELEGYPTWEFADGSRIPGKVPLAELSKKTGCPLPINRQR
ncbi:MAG: hypothetical protein A2788_01905 [Candidatus Abawacabacteria bacterium RIFCSPHIGHO2_01_FULL_46_8]|uniref:Thioredoxin domain-containing protein n=1 Tax=Candidatus Abawacabacteria bacterium RIFCSPHIGHO2_01_FULL_46_8 TaxID=1817815 RepID=A0A1F4XJJ0_9BACT|nr:MAG: hypothetical protein A2788_01905 [Candidatus Abawacabacteria bacterium RIFCSPHIGHO2_01_FULL_46_8]